MSQPPVGCAFAVDVYGSLRMRWLALAHCWSHRGGRNKKGSPREVDEKIGRDPQPAPGTKTSVHVFTQQMPVQTNQHNWLHDACNDLPAATPSGIGTPVSLENLVVKTTS